ncbi:MAG: hypothetical protein AAGA95_22095, partial [Pseudomonadota bacterium]
NEDSIGRLRRWLLLLLLVPVAGVSYGFQPTGALWVACILPLVFITFRHISLPLALVAGVSSIALIHAIEATPWSWNSLIPLLSMFVVAIVYMRRGVGPLKAPQSTSKDPAEQLAASLSRELARARRYERPLALLSIDAQADGETNRPDSADLQRLARVVRGVMRLGVDVHIVDGRIWALVSEADGNTAVALSRRLVQAGAAGGCLPRIGVAIYPDDAVCSDDLLKVAETRRESAHFAGIDALDIPTEVQGAA